MLAVFVIAMLASVLPSRLAQAAWQQGMVLALIDNSVVALVALVLLHLAAWINPGDLFSRALRDGAARWAVLAALLYVLLVPQQLVVAVVGPSFGQINSAGPLPRLKRNLEVILQQNQQRLRQQWRQREAASRADASANLLSPPLRASLSSLAYALAFAALTRRRGKRLSLLASLLFSGRGRSVQDPDLLGFEQDQV